MGSGYAACWVDIVEEKFIKKTCPKEWDVWERVSAEAGLSSYELTEIAENVYLNLKPKNEEKKAKAVRMVYLSLFRAFKKKTGLGLELGYHDCDNDGDRYDGVDGFYWSVSNVWQYTPAGKKNKHFIRTVGFVNYG